MGIDPAGALLRSTMPRYRLTRDDMQDLIGYLKKISAVLDRGLSPTSIRLGCILPGEIEKSARCSRSSTASTARAGFMGDPSNSCSKRHPKRIYLRWSEVFPANQEATRQSFSAQRVYPPLWGAPGFRYSIQRRTKASFIWMPGLLGADSLPRTICCGEFCGSRKTRSSHLFR